MSTTKTLNYTLTSSIEAIAEAVEYFLSSLCEVYNIRNDTILFEIRVILNELLLNAVKHGNKMNFLKDVQVVAGFMKGNNIFISVQDDGDGFDYSCIVKEKPDDCSCCEAMKETGRGMLIVKHLSDRMLFNKKGNKILVLKKVF